MKNGTLIFQSGYTSQSTGQYLHNTVQTEAMEMSETGGGERILIEKSHNRIGFVPLDIGSNHGAYQMANYRANISIRGNQNNIFVGVIRIHRFQMDK